jgi:sec-independent protein translocase protein TatC
MLEQKSNFAINLIELKYRSFYSFISLFTTFLVCFYFKIELFFLISNFFLKFESGFIYTSLLDPILIYLKLAFLFAIIFSLPVLIYMYGFFFIKSFYSFYLHFFIFYSFLVYLLTFFLFLGLSNSVLPELLDFLVSFQRVNVIGSYSLLLQATITQYYVFFFSYLYMFLLLIAVPNVYLLFLFVGFSSKKSFLSDKFRKYLYLAVILLFLMFAPPDFWVQIMMLPFIFFILEIYIYVITFLYVLYFSF